MGWKSTLRTLQAQERRQQREAQRRLRELERRAKEQAKLSLIEQARLEVETYENRLELLLSVHKECAEARDWHYVAAALSPPAPRKRTDHELRAKQFLASNFEQQSGPRSQTCVEEARLRDEQEYSEAVQSYSDEHARWEKATTLARRVLCGEHKAYTEALAEYNPLVEIGDLGSSVHFVVHSSKLIESTLKINGVDAIPIEVKTLTSSGKVSVKAMPKSRFHEVYQDYVCGCVLRTAREVFALLPVESQIITASADWLDPATGGTEERPVLSVGLHRSALDGLDYDQLDPSDAVEGFLHRGDFKASRKSGVFQPITPLTPADLSPSPGRAVSCADVLAAARRLREQITEDLLELRGVTQTRSCVEDTP